MAESAPAPAYPYSAFSELAGPLQEPPADGRVRFRLITRGWARVRARLLVLGAFGFELGFLVWLLLPSHHPEYVGDWRSVLAVVLLCSVAVIGLLQMVNVVTLALATLNARDPVPMTPLAGQRVAFLTTIVPGKEPLEMVRATLEAACRMHYDGRLDVWLLDEGDDAAVRAMCTELGVRHFSRKGIERWNQPSGGFKARTKHGNYNAWLDAHGEDYDLWVSVDTDHVPHPNMVERLVGYFRDPDVAFVVGPQVYGNYDNVVTKGAESQQYMFHSVLQRAGNRLASAMFVGTNNAVRVTALRAIGGLQDSITEDAATSLVWHSSRNPETGARWKSVYTPDVLAVGEGPGTWRDFFTQQHRWACGADQTILQQYRRYFRELSWAGRAHYTMLLAYYPSAAISWVLGALNLSAFMLTGVGGLVVTAQLWLMLYVNSAVLHLGVYFWNRRHNVSPHEQEGSSGVAGMAMSAMSAPVYVQALRQAVLRQEPGFVVTRKGAVSGDHLGVFRRHLAWGGLLVGVIVASVPLGHVHPAVHAWAVLSALMCLVPVACWLGTSAAARRATASTYRLEDNVIPEPRSIASAVVAPAQLAGLPQETLR
ncbi:cellulose synthase/poly-beta-1,6-N-acetylglucosamine synthase-like glycosyltransferase [Geodermatophilus tzadiensis]|uniref:Cellulose synthase/poly-beta-1,6-N-acetylglucosamine synthase-like glycosyltransferase n=1 Tax=Geodermatophilus tzadiensis TaxID=1137988 RepID=A0A2T0TZK2_9ACTN|nr:glycosyltransferase family 2 protein [Geodermatophilus tzadiensis]PRY51097.1 cellulose synthase/poly-beta-1,6-N-acetylglucosamine synthase-like glycosyltransferase [Geodermatophilus tzadiensis]